MYKLLLWIVLFSGSMLFAGDINWEADLESAFAKAAKENRPIVVVVESLHCRWCKKMIHKTLENRSISKRLENYIVVRAEKDEEETRSELPEVRFVPTIFFMTPKREILERVTGYFNVEDFNSWIDDAEKKMK